MGDLEEGATPPPVSLQLSLAQGSARVWEEPASGNWGRKGPLPLVALGVGPGDLRQPNS